MADREKLIELCGDLQELPCCYTYEGQADYLIANGVTLDNQVSSSKWIPVTERLPECDQVVLCYKKYRGVRIGKYLAATFADGVEAFKDLIGDYAFGATHWMPLPEPPKGE